MRIALCTCLVFVGLLASAKGPSNSPNQPAQTDLEYGEQAYKSNCTRCHTAPPALSPRQANTVMRHMRIKANLPARDAQAVYQYLLQSDRKQ